MKASQELKKEIEKVWLLHGAKAHTHKNLRVDCGLEFGYFGWIDEPRGAPPPHRNQIFYLLIGHRSAP